METRARRLLRGYGILWQPQSVPRSTRRWLRALTLLALSGSPVGLAHASTPAPSTESALHADLTVDTSAVGSSGPVIKSRLDELGAAELRRLDVMPNRVSGAGSIIHVEIRELAGDELGYAFELTLVSRDRRHVYAARSHECRCTEGELVELAITSIGDVVPILRDLRDAEEPAEPARPKADEPDDSAAPAPKTETRRHSRVSRASVGVMAAGTAALIPGVVLVALPPTPDREDPLYEFTTRPPGYALLAAGGGLLVTGAILLIVERARANSSSTGAARASRRGRARLQPALAPGSVGLTLRGSF